MNGTFESIRWAKLGISAALLLTLASPAASQFTGAGGPSVLSRGGNAPGMRGDESIALTFFAGVGGNYDNGIYVPQGETTAQGSEFGGGINWGVYGGHSWGRTNLGVDYRGDYRYYSANNSQNGTNNAIDLTFSHIFNRKWQVSVLETAGTTTQPFGAYFAPGYLGGQYASVPMTELYNSRIYYNQTSGYATYSWSARTLFTFGGSAFLTHRTVQGLVDTNGGNVQASWQRLLTKRSAVGATYMYTKYTYPPAFGTSDVHTLAGTYERNMGRFSSLYVSAGVSRIETWGTESYALSPEISAILGTPTGVRFFYDVTYIPTIQASLNYRKQYWSYSAGYMHGAVPGNGVYLTSQADTGSVGASYSPIRRMSFGVSASYSNTTNLWGSATGGYKYFQGGGGVTYVVARGLNMVTRVDWRKMTAGETINNQNSIFASVGFTYSSADRPLSLW